MSYRDHDEPYVVIEKRSSGIGGFLLGAALGAGVALLLAPRSGAATRRDIRRRARRARQSVERVAGEVTDSVTHTLEDARQKIENRIDDARQSIELKKAQVRRAVDAGRVAAVEARSELEERIAQSKAARREAAATSGGRTEGVTEN